MGHVPQDDALDHFRERVLDGTIRVLLGEVRDGVFSQAVVSAIPRGYVETSMDAVPLWLDLMHDGSPGKEAGKRLLHDVPWV